MSEPTIRFPVTCPECGAESLGEFALAEVAAALVESSGLRLSSPCHLLDWQAAPIEIEQIREYIAAVATPPSA